MKTPSSLVVLVVVSYLIIGTTASAQQDTADMAALQAEYMKLAQPADEHELLEKMVGTWHIVSTMYPAPGQDSVVTEGSSENEMILGGRFLESEIRSDPGPLSYDGLSIFGYDRRYEHYTMVAFDTWGTYYVTATGQYDPTTRKLTLSGSEPDPVGNMTQEYDFVYTFEDDRINFEVIFKNPELTHGQDEYKMVEVIYTQRTDLEEEDDDEK